ncbi:hypothetical protein QP794_24425 [Paenibacillus sp. UMB7766-LJ446]|uniref:hypothetical protein n=1 Tax=Paenibacillus sp. UMB7766-LJ446 TaxID=3046313 RepID=UPI00254C0B4A|nr:hypothetical protein [Paenibacillus sp. UMB7766-LJ446]MDK8193238.1 hypothetical protein [Paenibacillus sp. UMB7766-LJ446]
MNSRLLVDATDLVQWADRRDSQSVLPQLIRSLILSSSDHIEKISFAAGEGVSLGGWDGVTIAEESDSFVPKGTTVWEMGVNRSVKGKADDDYEKRSQNPLYMIPAQTTYIFITPRRWRDKEIWTVERKKEGIWKDILVYDADDLETWLRQNPTVHVWLSILLGKHPQNCTDLNSYWTDWSEETQPNISPEMVLAGREHIKTEIVHWLKNAHAPLRIQADTRDEAIAVFAASISLLPKVEKDFNLTKAIVVNTPEAWTYLSSSQNQLILIPAFDSEGLSRAIRNGHHIMIPLGRSDSTTSDTIQIPRLSRDRVTSILIDKGLDEHQSRELGLLARRGLTTFRRRTALSPEIRQPLWARPGEARSLVPLLLAGAWNETKDGDKESLNELAQCPYDELNEVLVRWANESDPPIRRIGHAWYVISKEDAWSLLIRSITPADIDKFRTVAIKVLSTSDPAFELPVEEQWMAGILGYNANYSGLFIRNIADTLAFMGSREDTFHNGIISLRVTASNIIYELFSNLKGNWRAWSTLSSVLPLLAEAAPAQFLEALENEVLNEDSILKLFNDQKDSRFGSSPHTGLLWALETLAWNPEHLGRVAFLLARLSRIDPGGKLSNRPNNSLREIFLTWNPKTSASIDQRIQILEMIIQREPTVGWELLCRLLPEFHGVGRSTTKPKWRDWAPDQRRDVLIAEYDRMTHEIVKILLAEVGESGERWNEIIQSLPMLPLEDFELVLDELNRLGDTGIGSEDKGLIWNSLRKIISKHRSFPDADWALPANFVDRIEETFNKFEPVETSSRFSWLFSNSPELPEGREREWEERLQKLHEARTSALTSIYERGGIKEIIHLLNNVEQPYQFGSTLGELRLIEEEEDNLLLEYLDSADNKLAQFARGYMLGSIKCLGSSWALKKLEIHNNWEANKKAEILMFLPANESTWSLLGKLGDEVEKKYWSLVSPYSINEKDLETAVTKYIQYELLFLAIELLALQKEYAKPNQITEALTKLLSLSPNDNLPSNSFSYHISELFSKLESCEDIDEGELASLEWAYLPVLDQYGHTPKLLHRELSRNSNFFSEVISLVYNSENEELKEPTAGELQRASQGEDLLKSWRTLPGLKEDNSVNKQELFDWASNSLQATFESGRGKYGARYIGEILSASIVGEDGGWPHEAVRDVIEQFSNKDLELAFTRELYNSRGVVTKQVNEGGLQEKKLADKYNEYAKISGSRWPRTTALLRSIAETYNREAQQEDMSAELREDLDN